MDEHKREAYRAGIAIMIILAVLTIGETLIGAVAGSWWAPLLLIAALKAFFVVRDYMHLPRLFAPEEETHS